MCVCVCRAPREWHIGAKGYGKAVYDYTNVYIGHQGFDQAKKGEKIAMVEKSAEFKGRLQ